VALEAWRSGKLPGTDLARLLGVSPGKLGTMFTEERPPAKAPRRPASEPNWL
jgi:hypothetical protein